MSSDLELKPHPTCQASHPSQCSGCYLAYDCGRVREGRSFSWGLVALAIAGILALFAQKMV